MKEWALKNGYSESQFTPQLIKEITSDEKYVNTIKEQMKQKEDEFLLNGLEKVKKIAFELEMFSVENGLLTPTFKLKRNIAKAKFNSVIESMYEGVAL